MDPFIPIKRYGLPGNLPFDLEPYRLLVGLVIAAWFVLALLIDPRVRFRKAGLEGRFPRHRSCRASCLTSPTRTVFSSLLVQAEVIKGLMFLGSFFLRSCT